jgi:hypothetical protein
LSPWRKVVVKGFFFVKLFDSIEQIFYLTIFVAHRLETKAISLIEFGRIEEKVVDVFHFNFVDFLFRHLVGSFMELLNSQRRSYVIS